MKEIKVMIGRQQGYDSLWITFYHRAPHPSFKMVVLNPVQIEEEVYWKWVEVEDGLIYKPTIELPGLWLGNDNAPLVSLANALAEEGIFPDKFKAVDEVLEQTKYHLEDMRKLTFKDFPEKTVQHSYTINENMLSALQVAAEEKAKEGDES